MRVSVPIDSSDAKATSSGDTTRRDGFGTPHAGANTNVSNGPTDARSTNRRIMALALPTFGQLIAEPTFILIDTAIVGHIGDAALAGLSIGSTIILTAVGLCIFLAYSTTAQVAHLLGAGRRREGLQAGIDGLWLALSIGTVLGLGLFAAAEPLCRALGGQGEVLEQAVTYTRAIVLGAPGMLMVYAANGISRGLQKVRITLIAAVGGAVVNTVLDVLFVMAFRCLVWVSGSGGWWCWSGSLGVWIPRRCSPPPCNCLTRGGCRAWSSVTRRTADGNCISRSGSRRVRGSPARNRGAARPRVRCMTRGSACGGI